MKKNLLKLTGVIVPIITAIPFVASSCGSKDEATLADLLKEKLTNDADAYKYSALITDNEKLKQFKELVEEFKKEGVDLTAKGNPSDVDNAIKTIKEKTPLVLARTIKAMVENGSAFIIKEDGIASAKQKLENGDIFAQVYPTQYKIGRSVYTIIEFTEKFKAFYSTSKVFEVARISTFYENKYGGKTQPHANGVNLEFVKGKLNIKFVICDLLKGDQTGSVVLVNNLLFAVEK